MIQQNSLPRVRSALLSQFPNVDFAMSTRQGDDSGSVFHFNLGLNVGDDPDRVVRNMDRFFSVLGLGGDRIASMEQQHGTAISEANEPGVYPATDVLVSHTCGLGLAIRIADCVPIVLYAPASNVIAAIHAGWKGTAAHVAAQTVGFLTERYGIEPSSVFAFLGPAARACCYEVQPEVASLFPESVVVKRGDDSLFLDLHEANVHQLLHAGIDRRNIEVEPLCTVCNPAFFHSHRRDAQTSGRMLAVVCMKEEAG
jgi:polyphenol oxidase